MSTVETPPVTPRPAQSPLVGMAWMLGASSCFVMVQALVKHVGSGVPAAEAAFLRYILGLVFLIPMLGALRQARITRQLWALFTLRGLAHGVGVICWFYAMTRIPMAEVTAMNYMNPVYITIGAALVLGERLAWPRMTAIGVAVVGGFIILRPGFREIDLGHIAMIVTAMLFAVSYLIAGKASRDVSATVVVAMLSLMVPVAMAPFAIAVWVTPTLPQLGWLFLVAGFATMGHYTMTRAFAAAPMAVTQPVMFLQLVWSTAIGWAIFGEGVDAWVIIGGTIVLGAVTFITWREARKKRASTAR